MRSGFLHVPQRHAGVQRRGDKRVPQGVRPDRLADPGAAGDPADDSRSAVPVQPAAVGARRLERPQLMLLAPAGVLSRNPARASRSDSVNTGSMAATAVDMDMVAMGDLPGSG